MIEKNDWRLQGQEEYLKGEKYGKREKWNERQFRN